ncbi:ATP-binding protein [Frankia sp. B2]|uniref:ATP-binding protein n=1 Tax=Frankia sp. B2 TaxID=2541730 RepID=UPI00106ABE49|nr:ATP-binding protein [Frankia sp. B2]TFE28351.1 ATP-binding protein [Frankia sp. B2]
MLAGFRFHRILTAPRRPDTPDRPDPVPAALFAALVGAHAQLTSLGPGHEPTASGASTRGGPYPVPGAARPGIAVAWLRGPGEAHIRFLAGGRPFFPADPTATDPTAAATSLATATSTPAATAVPLLYPPGSTAVALPPDAVPAQLAGFPYWLRCEGLPDALWAADPGTDARQPDTRRGSFDDYAAHLVGPFAWLVLAWPVPPEHLAEERADLARSIPVLRRRENDQGARLDLERAEARYRELGRGASSGMWDVEILVGGVTPAGAVSLAALLCSSSDLDRLPYTLRPTGPVTSFAGALGGVGAGVGAGAGGLAGSPRSSPRASAELLAALARPPGRELPGITLITPHAFDVTPEGPNRSGPADPRGTPGAVRLGDVLDAGWMPAGAFSVSLATLNRHAFVCGATGSGKSQTVRSLLESLTRAPAPVPWLVLEPAKAEYARMAGRLAGLAEVLVIRPGRLDAPPASLNPLEPEPGFPLQSHIDLVRALFLAAFEAHEPFPQVLARALTVCYQDLGWNLVLDRPEPAHRPRFRVTGPEEDPKVDVRRRYPTLGDLQRTATRVVENIGYGVEVTADVRGFVDVRIGSLREGSPGRFFEGGHPIDIGALLARNVVFELEDITSDQDKAFLLGAVLIRVVEHLRVRYATAGAGGLRHVLVLEEAHRLLKNVTDGPAAASVDLFASLLAEIRAYGEGLVVVEQIPAKILPDVIKNTALKVMHRLPAADDREAVGATMNLRDDQSELVVALPAGVAAMSADGMDRPVLARMVAGDDRESARYARYDRVPLAGRRSLGCGAACVAGPACTLEETETSALAARDPLLVVWVEAVAAHQVMGFTHLLGIAPFAPAEPLRTTLAALPGRILDCALAHAADRATDARAAALRPFVDPDDFTAALLATLRRLLGLPPSPADAAEAADAADTADTANTADTADTANTVDSRHLTAGMYRWQDVRQALVDAVRRRGAGAGPHPLTAAWRERGLTLPGETVGEQLTRLKNGAFYAPGREKVNIGDPAVSGLTVAVRELTGAADATSLSDALHQACTGKGLAELATQISDLVGPAPSGPGSAPPESTAAATALGPSIGTASAFGTASVFGTARD